MGRLQLHLRHLDLENDCSLPLFLLSAYRHIGHGILGLSSDTDRDAGLTEVSGPWRFSSGPRRTIRQSVTPLCWLALGLIALGVVGRLVRYFLQFPIWGDEAFVCFNLLDRDFSGMTDSLEYGQVAPILFLWAELVVTRLLGTSELAMRLLPLLAALAALGLFWHLAWRTVSPLAALFAVGLLAVARWPVTMGSFVKPYSLDLLLTLVLIIPAVEWLRRPEQICWLIVLTLAMPVALLASYPAVFIAGGVSLALLPTAWRSSWTSRALFITCNVLAAAAFMTSYAIVGQKQQAPWLIEYWADSFPPGSLWPLVKWFVLRNTGQLMAVPVGDVNGGSTITALLFAFGVWKWWNAGRWSLLVLFLTPFVLNVLAAAVRLYPYGVARLSQDLVPAICLMAGTGLAALLERFVHSDAVRMRWTLRATSVLALCGVAGLVLDVIRPYRDPETQWMRQTAGAILARLGTSDTLVVVQDRYDVPSPFRWYLESAYRDVSWRGRFQSHRSAAENNSLVTVNFWFHRSQDASMLPNFVEPAAQGWATVEQTPYTMRSRDGKWTFHVEVRRWDPQPKQREGASPR